MLARVGRVVVGAARHPWRQFRSRETIGSPKMASNFGGARNRLGLELSPYLKQHKDNPVDWYPWGPEAFARAKKEEKMIFLSIGYSTCHWCHVMERESFEDEEIAQVMNKHYINVKIDREERPDIDRVYMSFVQATTGSGGWPLSLFLAPNLKPVYGGTYFPPRGNYGRPGFKEVLMALVDRWKEKKSDMEEAGDQVLTILDTRVGGRALNPASRPPESTILHKFFAQLNGGYDSVFGGYSGAPKFPQPSNLLTMFKLHKSPKETQDRKKRELEMNLHTLDMMARGGIHDHISQGFARYSTDRQWHVPHFEKMLYDQAQLMVVYTIAAQLTGKSQYSNIVDDIFTYVSRDLTHNLGGFFSAEDADSYPSVDSNHKKEGAFCVWSFEEINSILSEKVEGTNHTLADVVVHHYNVKEGGNVDPRGDPHGELKGKNVLTEITKNNEAKPPLFGSEEDQVTKYEAALAKARKKLYEHRQTRPRPGLDDKILCSWNGLMISGLVRAGAALAKTQYTEAAIKAANFVRKHMYDNEEKMLLRSVYGGKPDLEQRPVPIQGFIEDYCFFIQALLDLYEATFDLEWLEWAIELQEQQDSMFLDTKNGGYFASKKDDDQIVLQLKDDHDGAEPSSNSVSAMNLLRLSKLLKSDRYKTQAVNIFKLFGSRLTQAPVAMPALVDAYNLWHLSCGHILAVSGSKEADSLLAACRAKFLPSLTYVRLEKGGPSGSLAGNPLLSEAAAELEVATLICPNLEMIKINSVDELETILSKPE